MFIYNLSSHNNRTSSIATVAWTLVCVHMCGYRVNPRCIRYRPSCPRAHWTPPYIYIYTYTKD